MGLAVYNSIILDLHFPSICYRKLLSPPVVPPVDTSGVGVVRQPTIEDLGEIMPVSPGLHSIKLSVEILKSWNQFPGGCQRPWRAPHVRGKRGGRHVHELSSLPG